MKRVIENDKIVLVPKSYIECSVCGHHFPPEHYREADKAYQTRTNCTACYNLSSEEAKHTYWLLERHRNTVEYRWLKIKLAEVREYEEYSMSVEEMIAELQKLPKGARLVMTHQGYYATGKVGAIFSPEKNYTIDDVDYYAIGHSAQNPG